MALETGETPIALFTDRERTAFAFADEVLGSTLRRQNIRLGAAGLLPRQIVELLLLIGYFRMFSGLMTNLDVEVEAPFAVKILDQAGKAEDRPCEESSLQWPDNSVLSFNK